MVRLLPKNRNAPLIWTDILNILIYAYNFWAPIILVPLVMALLGRHVSTPRFLWGAGAGVVMLLAWTSVLGRHFGIDGLVMGVFANLAFFCMVDRKASGKADPS